MIKPYDYSHRKGVEDISWERFGELAALLTERLAVENIEIVVGIARAGLFPATAVACALRREFFPVRVTRRQNDLVVAKHPIWKVDGSEEVREKVVAVIDEIADTGETLALVAQRILDKGAKHVVTASLVSHTWADPSPDHVALLSDALVIFPWDKRVYQDGRWQFHPELADALNTQHRQRCNKKGLE
jgi:hypoxanthine phosphoribosyltransferase